jgi:hypothetical protein
MESLSLGVAVRLQTLVVQIESSLSMKATSQFLLAEQFVSMRRRMMAQR